MMFFRSKSYDHSSAISTLNPPPRKEIIGWGRTPSRWTTAVAAVTRVARPMTEGRATLRRSKCVGFAGIVLWMLRTLVMAGRKSSSGSSSSSSSLSTPQMGMRHNGPARRLVRYGWTIAPTAAWCPVTVSGTDTAKTRLLLLTRNNRSVVVDHYQASLNSCNSSLSHPLNSTHSFPWSQTDQPADCLSALGLYNKQHRLWKHPNKQQRSRPFPLGERLSDLEKRL